ncbi:MAG: hypothetical protein ACOCP8_01165 [archaeon]
MIGIMIGIAIVFLGVGFVIAKMLNKDFFEKIKNKRQEKLKQKEKMRALELQAREEALKNLYPEIVKKMQEKELKKITGEDKKEKMQKFANAFSMGGQTNNTQDKISNMLGNTNNKEDKISNMLGNTGFNTDTNKILGTKKEEKEETEQERIKRLIGI